MPGLGPNASSVIMTCLWVFATSKHAGLNGTLSEDKLKRLVAPHLGVRAVHEDFLLSMCLVVSAPHPTKNTIDPQALAAWHAVC